MKSKNLTFDRFRGLDFRSTIDSISYSGKTNPIGFQEVYGKILNGIIHPIKDLSTEVATKSGRLFKVKNKCYVMTTSGLDEITGTTTLTNRVSATYADRKDYRKILEVNRKASSSTLDGNCTTTSASTYIKSSTTLGENVYSGLLVEVFAGGSTSKGVYYINSNDTDTIYIEGALDYIPGTGDTFSIYLPVNYLLVYDGSTVRIYNWGSGYSLIDSFSLSYGFVEVWNNRLLTIDDKKIEFSTISHGGYFPYLNYIYTETSVSDMVIFGNQLLVFTEKGTYALSGTGYLTISFDKINEYKFFNMVYPIIYDGRIFISDEGRIYPFEQMKGLEYNYRLIPDTPGRIFSIDDGIVFPLGHSSSKYGLINIEEIKNEQIISITNYVDGSLEDIVNFNGYTYAIISGKLYKDNGNKNISVKINKIDYNNKIFFDRLTLTTSGTNPSTITYNVGSGDVSSTKVTSGGRDERYPINKWSDNITISFTTTETIQSFNLLIQI